MENNTFTHFIQTIQHVEIVFSFIFAIIWLLASFIVGFAASKKGRSYLGYLSLSLIFSPIFILLILLIIGEKDNTQEIVWRASNLRSEKDFKAISKIEYEEQLDNLFPHSVYESHDSSWKTIVLTSLGIILCIPIVFYVIPEIYNVIQQHTENTIYKQSKDIMKLAEIEALGKAMEQYNMVLKSGTSSQRCVYVGLVVAAAIQANREDIYQEYQKLQRQDCTQAGVPQWAR